VIVTVDESAITTAEGLVAAFEGKPDEARGLFSRDFVLRVRKWKDAKGYYVWACGPTPEQDTIAGHYFDLIQTAEPKS